MCMNSYCPVSIDRMNLSIDSFFFRKPRKNYTLLDLLQTRLYIVIYVLGVQLVNSKSPLPVWIVLASTKLHDTIQSKRLWHSFHDPYQNLESEHTVVPDTQKKQYRLEHLKEKLSIRASVLLQWKDVHYCLSAAFYFERICCLKDKHVEPFKSSNIFQQTAVFSIRSVPSVVKLLWSLSSRPKPNMSMRRGTLVIRGLADHT